MGMTDTIKEMFGGTPDVSTLQGLFVEMLKDVYDAEHRILESLPTMAESATNAQLQRAFEKHRTETEGQVGRLEQIFDMMGLEAERKTCDAIKGLISESEETIDMAEGHVLDAGLIASAQAVEHYEIARYGTLKHWAQTLGLRDVVKLLDATLTEEMKTDGSLNELAETTVNPSAFVADVLNASEEGRGSSRRS